MEGVTLYCCPKLARVDKEGPLQQLFNAAPLSGVTEGKKESEAPDKGGDNPAHTFHMSRVTEDIALVQSLGFKVDDDNNPTPENIPGVGEELGAETNTTGGDENGKATWEWDGICPRKANNHSNNKPAIQGVNKMNILSMIYGTMSVLLFLTI